MNAIILAAGKGERLRPLTNIVPKPLLKINGEPIIERQIRFLLDSNVDSIVIVAGYMYTEFLYLKDKFPGVEIVINEQYDTTNNFYSLFLVKNKLKNTWIVEGDIYLMKNIFREHLESVYYTSLKPIVEYEWFFEYENTRQVRSICIADRRKNPDSFNDKYNILLGISYWTEASCLKIISLIDSISQNKSAFENYCNSYWDQLVARHLNLFELYIHPVSERDWFELDSIYDLQNLLSLLERPIKVGSFLINH
ncbi:CTP:phosphocholine cytidylyltransferase [Pedobacter sp. ok626]|uniref:sugar phosphate nucleotidyltransferase n=1 Tax=Pedobacter sp. ok626 TaxID=1761882 RepID=UPI000881D552|nr:NTP transferase domain-containing protein [Pedobacter sp. ok626]SDK92616.1 CTP:phosphocholine cytidylyltransferase [Pedobacter sp. ok626]